MFEPGQLHLARMRLLPTDSGFSIDIRYQVEQQGKAVSFHVTGEVNGEAIDEGFTLTRDSAFNFASDIDHLLRRHQVLSPEFMSLTTHHEYDAMFEDIRSQLHAWHGEAIDLDQFT
ncbi:protein of unknown function [Halopseudomonas sabulinigri]|uniref:DUF5064 family protein n=1 Tax=Halopseudomonas sabulinigri TaxID=472181 RepID=A0A1H1NF68_9GAMM|nr:DUF5064 family protein [Halopseudomonas sabulinigri]SDR97574.1 protein of unknown function [Halopseudomonas sabulinigri]